MPATRKGIAFPHSRRRSRMSWLTGLNPVSAGLVSRPEDWRWSNYNEYTGMSAEEQNKHCGLIADRVRMHSDPRARI